MQIACVCHENQKLGVLKDIFKNTGIRELSYSQAQN